MFNKLKELMTSTREKPVMDSRSTNEIIDEIHDTFYTEVDRLTIYGKQANSLDTDHKEALDKRERLLSLGFTNTIEVKEAESEVARLQNLKEDNSRKVQLIEAIEYFSLKYPQYKFITEDSVKKICAKYGLFYSSVTNYIGTVPDANLKHIEAFKVAEKDMMYRMKIIGFRHEEIKILTYDEVEREAPFSRYSHHYGILQREERFDISEVSGVEKTSLEICAPLKDFNLTDKEIKGFEIVNKKIEIPDPVVIQPVSYRGVKYYLIVTAWGQEASDELVVNQKMN